MGALILSAIVALPLITVLISLVLPGAPVFTDALGRYLFNTTVLMVFVGALSAVIGIGAAWCVTVADFPLRRILSWALVLPLAAPAYIVAYIYTDLLTYSGPVQSAIRDVTGWGAQDYVFPEIRSLPGAVLMLALVLYPYVYLLARAAFSAQSRSEFQAARSLGLSPATAFFRIALPGARPAIAGGLALVLMETLADFGVADYFAIPTFSTGIFRTWLAMGDRLGAMKLAGIMLLFVIALVLVERRGRRGRVASQDRIGVSEPIFRLRGIKGWLVSLACVVPVTLGFLIPVGLLLNYSLRSGDQIDARYLGDYAWNSILLAGTAAILATGLAIFLAYSQRRAENNPVLKTSIRIATLGYALPGALLAVGLLGALGPFDQWITRSLRDMAGWQGGLILSGSLAMLSLAMIMRFLTVSFNSVTGGMEKIPPSMDAAARSLGAGAFRMLSDIHIPLLRQSVFAGAALVFIDVMRELPATLILRPFNFETLATRVYRLASDERLTEASTAALIIVLLGLLPVLLLHRVGQDRRR